MKLKIKAHLKKAVDFDKMEIRFIEKFLKKCLPLNSVLTSYAIEDADVGLYEPEEKGWKMLDGTCNGPISWTVDGTEFSGRCHVTLYDGEITHISISDDEGCDIEAMEF